MQGAAQCLERLAADPDGAPPRGEVHAWTPGANQTLRGLLLHGSRLDRYPHVEWADVQTESGRPRRRRLSGLPALHRGRPIRAPRIARARL